MNDDAEALRQKLREAEERIRQLEQWRDKFERRFLAACYAAGIGPRRKYPRALSSATTRQRSKRVSNRSAPTWTKSFASTPAVWTRRPRSPAGMRTFFPCTSAQTSQRPN